MVKSEWGHNWRHTWGPRLWLLQEKTNGISTGLVRKIKEVKTWYIFPQCRDAFPLFVISIDGFCKGGPSRTCELEFACGRKMEEPILHILVWANVQIAITVERSYYFYDPHILSPQSPDGQGSGMGIGFGSGIGTRNCVP